ncbi:GNAT family N-acetyltransferase [Alkalibacterium olivapovliticus]|uniref:Putative GNAT family N-acyltransferase n=1 Tax=Alkalibacterium olivapovliticus TaxID=99907 RepID=A0A2T0W8S0_9LACT|nr:GNAT family N-acetyltransferase [Alkalibacterium olivapovliticus]PRY83101.1 putative GNAT family N-acyltransferase [Alkalibacterium olivapovliticus]
MKIHIGNENWNQAAAYYIRMSVFVLEKGIALEDEFDGHDHDQTVYVVVYDGDQPVATGRFLKTDDHAVRPGRIAVLKDYRNKGFGDLVITELEKYAKNEGCHTSVIHGELSAAGFYEKLGYRREPGVYEEDGVPCVTLKKTL